MAGLFDRLKDMISQKKQQEEKIQSDAELYAKIVKAGKEGNSLDGLKEDFLKAVQTHEEARDNAIYKLPLANGMVLKTAVNEGQSISALYDNYNRKVGNDISYDQLSETIGTAGGFSVDQSARIGQRSMENAMEHIPSKGDFQDYIKNVISFLEQSGKTAKETEYDISLNSVDSQKKDLEAHISYDKGTWAVKVTDRSENNLPVGEIKIGSNGQYDRSAMDYLNSQVKQKEYINKDECAKNILQAAAYISTMMQPGKMDLYQEVNISGHSALVSCSPDVSDGMLKLKIHGENGQKVAEAAVKLNTAENLSAQLLAEANSDMDKATGPISRQIANNRDFLNQLENGLGTDPLRMSNSYIVGTQTKPFSLQSVMENAMKYPGAYRINLQDTELGKVGSSVPINVYNQNGTWKVVDALSMKEIDVSDPAKLLNIAKQVAPKSITSVRAADQARQDHPDKIGLRDVVAGAIINCMQNGEIDRDKLVAAIKYIAANENITIPLKQNIIGENGDNKYAQIFVSPDGKVAMVEDHDMKDVKMLNDKQLAEMMPKETFCAEGLDEKIQQVSKDIVNDISHAIDPLAVANMKQLADTYEYMKEPVMELVEALQDKFLPEGAQYVAPTEEGAVKIAEALNKLRNRQVDISDPQNYPQLYEAVKNAMGEQYQPVEKQQQKIVAASIKISTEKIGHLLDERRALSNKTRDLMSIGG